MLRLAVNFNDRNSATRPCDFLSRVTMLMFLSYGGGEVSKRGREREVEISREIYAAKSRSFSGPCMHTILLRPRICYYNAHAYIHDVYMC